MGIETILSRWRSQSRFSIHRNVRVERFCKKLRPLYVGELHKKYMECYITGMLPAIQISGPLFSELDSETMKKGRKRKELSYG